MFAVIKTGGKQYKVAPKDKLKVEKLSAKEGEEVVFDQVLLRGEEIGTPLVSGAKVKAKILKQGRARKVEVVKFKNKTRYSRHAGHRQAYTEVEILSV